MKILLTGASSFTGHWFVRELASAGHEVTAIFRRKLAEYEGVRRERVERLSEVCEQVCECEFGDQRFLDLAGSRSWDLLCHHAAQAGGYKSREFDVVGAVASNTHNIRGVLRAAADGGCGRVLLTGSVFEPNEGAGAGSDHAVSPYGLSKGLTAQIVRHYCHDLGLTMGKFIISNPFGPMEEPRFTSYLAKTWFSASVATVRTPVYVRDNIHVSLLARAYADFAASLVDGAGPMQLNPSGYVESQGAFALRFARELRPRLRLPCELELIEQREFTEPRMRVNTDPLDAVVLGWDEARAWDELADYYRECFSPVEP